MPKNVRARRLTPVQRRKLDAEIGFLEGLVTRDAEWVDAWKLLADDYTRRGRVLDGLKADQRLATLCPGDPEVFYNLACSHSLAERFDDAIAALDRAVRLGYDDFKWLARDPDMAKLRKQPNFKRLLAKFSALQS